MIPDENYFAFTDVVSTPQNRVSTATVVTTTGHERRNTGVSALFRIFMVRDEVTTVRRYRNWISLSLSPS